MKEFDTTAKKRQFAISLRKMAEDKEVYAIYDSSDEEEPEVFLYGLELLMHYLNPTNKPWYAIGRNMGWRGTSGEATIKLADDKQTPWDLLSRLLPKTNQMYLEVTIDLHEKSIPKSGFIINCKHHDNPVNGDKYTVRVA